MINFKEHDGMLFKMLEEPTPLTSDAGMPCLVRLIQDDSPMGRFNKLMDFTNQHLDMKYVADKVSSYGIYTKIPIMPINCLANYEIIGTFVEEGSADWAAWRMMEGDKVTKGHLEHTYWHYDARPHLQCISEYICGTLQIMVSPEIWIKTADKDGWQIYKEPKHEPQYKVGDCRIEFVKQELHNLLDKI